jgi:hypothetical protein
MNATDPLKAVCASSTARQPERQAAVGLPCMGTTLAALTQQATGKTTKRHHRLPCSLILIVTLALAPHLVGASCWETTVLAATSISGATDLPPLKPAVPSTTVAQCRRACCAAELCVAWSLDTLKRRDLQCSLFASRGVLARANRSSIVSSYRAMSVPLEASWSWSWDKIPLYSHSSNTSGAYNSRAVANLTSKRWGMGLITLDWEQNYTQTSAHHLRQSTVSQARAIVAAAPDAKVLGYVQGYLALNFSDSAGIAIQNSSKDNFWVHNPDGTLFEVSVEGNCEFGQQCGRVMNASVPELRKWWVEKVALPTLQSDGVAGLFIDNSMALGLGPSINGGVWPASVAVQRESAQMLRLLGEATQIFAAGKRILFSIYSRDISFTDNQPVAPPVPYSNFALITAKPSSTPCGVSGLYYEDVGRKTRTLVPSCTMCGMDLCDATVVQQISCAKIKALAPGPPFECSMLPYRFVKPAATPPCDVIGTYFEDKLKGTKTWVPTCDMCGMNTCTAATIVSCATMRALHGKNWDPKGFNSAFNCSMLPGLSRSPPPPSPVITEQELVTYWRNISWGRYYDGAAPRSWITDPSPAACVAFVRNMQFEALAGIPVVVGTGGANSAGAKSPLSEAGFRKALAMFLIAAGNHSRFGYMDGYDCYYAAAPPPYVWRPTRSSGDTCAWKWRPEFERPLGDPRSWANWNGAFKFEREFEHLNVTLDCAAGTAKFDWRETPTVGPGSGPTCVLPPSELRVPCGHPPYTPADGCTPSLGCCYNPISVPGDWCYPMVNNSRCADKCHMPAPSCPSPSPPSNKERTGCDLRQLRTVNFSACKVACCGESRCTAWNWDSNLTASQAPKTCSTPLGSLGEPRSCCWLKSCPGSLTTNKCGGTPHCDSWSGSSGRPPSPPPPIPPPPAQCPPGWIKASWDSPVGCMDPLGNGSRAGLPAGYDCEVRKHAYEFAVATLPQRGTFKTAFDALQLQACGEPVPSTQDKFVPPRFSPSPTSKKTFYVDSNATDQSGDGSLLKPFATLEEAVDSAARETCVADVTIELRAGTYRTAGIVLTHAHSGLTIQNYQGEAAIVSGAVTVPSPKDRWTVHNAVTNTWRLDLKGVSGLPAEAFGMRVGTRRATMARFPNGDSELGSGLSVEALPVFPREHEPVSKTTIYESNPHDWPGVFWLNQPEGGPLPNAGVNVGGTGHWFDAYGGLCSGRQAPYGFWCSPANPRSQLPNDFQQAYNMPGGFSYAGTSSSGDLARAANWSQPQGAVFHMRSNFYSVQCLVDTVDKIGQKVHFDYSVGCDQGGPAPGAFPYWFVENVLEECDSPGEFFYDSANKSLYFTFNATEKPTGNEDFSLTRTKVIFNVTGTMAKPVRDVTIRGLVIRDAAYTYLGTTPADIHYLPASSDWTIQRSGAVLLEGTERFHFEKNCLTKCDGNGIFLSDFNRNTSISENEISWIGDNAMSAFGSMDTCLDANCSRKLPYPSGVDGRQGNQPRYTRVISNLVHEVGMMQKQSGAWAQHLTAATHLEGNIFLNGPHAAVDFNDGFGP